MKHVLPHQKAPELKIYTSGYHIKTAPSIITCVCGGVKKNKKTKNTHKKSTTPPPPPSLPKKKKKKKKKEIYSRGEEEGGDKKPLAARRARCHTMAADGGEMEVRAASDPHGGWSPATNGPRAEAPPRRGWRGARRAGNFNATAPTHIHTHIYTHDTHTHTQTHTHVLSRLGEVDAPPRTAFSLLLSDTNSLTPMRDVYNVCTQRRAHMHAHMHMHTHTHTA